MTRALSNTEKKFKEYERSWNREERRLSFSMLAGANSYFDWVLPCFLRNPESERAGQVQVISLEELVSGEITEETGDTYTKERLKNWDLSQYFPRNTAQG